MDMPLGSNNAVLGGTATAPAFSMELGDVVPRAVNPHDINREATRYLVFVGDLITAPQKRERKDLISGGEYYGGHFKTLLRSKGLLRKCQITPLEVAYDFISSQVLGDNPTRLVIANQQGDPRTGTQLNSIPVMPGDEIKGILAMDRNHSFGSKGVMEIESLQGVDYADFVNSGLQKDIFPNWDQIMLGVEALPVKLSEIVAGLNERRQNASADAKSIIDVYLESASRFRIWGTDYCKFSSQLVRQPLNAQGFAHTYSALAESLFDQLEIRREDLLATDFDIQKMTQRASEGKISNDEIASVMARMAENQELLTKFIIGQKDSPIEAVKEVDDVFGEEVIEETITCSATTASGNPCKGKATANGLCMAHSK